MPALAAGVPWGTSRTSTPSRPSWRSVWGGAMLTPSTGRTICAPHTAAGRQGAWWRGCCADQTMQPGPCLGWAASAAQQQRDGVVHARRQQPASWVKAAASGDCCQQPGSNIAAGWLLAASLLGGVCDPAAKLHCSMASACLGRAGCSPSKARWQLAALVEQAAAPPRLQR